MYLMSRNSVGLATGLALLVSACGGDVTGVTSGDELSSEEVAIVMTALASVLDGAGVQAGQVAAAGPALAAINIDENFNETVACDSGDVKVSGSMDGTVDDETFAMDATMEVAWEPNGCVVSDEVNTFTVDGAPEIRLTLDMVTTEQSVSLSGTETGGFSFTSSDGRAGSCAIDVTFEIVTTDSSLSNTVTGTVCGLEADAFVTLGT